MTEHLVNPIEVEIRFGPGAVWVASSKEPMLDMPGFDAADALAEFKRIARSLYGDDLEFVVVHQDIGRTGPAAGMR